LPYFHELFWIIFQTVLLKGSDRIYRENTKCPTEVQDSSCKKTIQFISKVHFLVRSERCLVLFYFVSPFLFFGNKSRRLDMSHAHAFSEQLSGNCESHLPIFRFPLAIRLPIFFPLPGTRIPC